MELSAPGINKSPTCEIAIPVTFRCFFRSAIFVYFKIRFSLPPIHLYLNPSPNPYLNCPSAQMEMTYLVTPLSILTLLRRFFFALCTITYAQVPAHIQDSVVFIVPPDSAPRIKEELQISLPNGFGSTNDIVESIPPQCHFLYVITSRKS